MKKLVGFSLLSWFFLIHLSYAGSLQEVYQNAGPGLGYDKLLVLHKDSLYTGGLTISNERVGIRGNGAVIDLLGGGIIVTGESLLEVDGCVFVDGHYALDISGTVDAIVSQCTFYSNTRAISYMSTQGSIEVSNTIITDSRQYGFACHEDSYRILHYIDMYENTGGDYMEFCPG